MGDRKQVQTRSLVESKPEAVLAAWTDTERWPRFLDGFYRVVEVSEDWPAVGSRLVWEALPGGRGRVREYVSVHASGQFTTESEDPSMLGEQTLLAEALESGQTRLTLTLVYELRDPTRFQALMDSLFIRRALGASLLRTLEFFVVELAEGKQDS